MHHKCCKILRGRHDTDLHATDVVVEEYYSRLPHYLKCIFGVGILICVISRNSTVVIDCWNDVQMIVY